MFAYVKMLYFSAAKIIKSGGGGNFIVGIVHFLDIVAAVYKDLLYFRKRTLFCPKSLIHAKHL